MTESKSIYSDENASRLILDNAQDAFILISSQLTVIYCNRIARDNILNFIGISLVPGTNILDMADESMKTALKEKYTRILLGQRYVSENAFVDSEGVSIIFESSFHPAYDANEDIVGIIISSKEITASKKVQQTIRDSEERLQFALEAAAQGAWDWNLKTNEVIYSSSYKRLYGFEENDLKNDVSEWITRIHPEDQQKMRASVTDHLRAEQREYDSKYRIRAKDGSYRWVMAKGRLVAFDENGNALRMIGTHTDITEAVERELALEQMNQRFDCMIKATHELLWEWDIPNDYVYRAKDAVKKVYGVSDDSGIRNVEAWLEHVHPSDKYVVRNVLNQALDAAHHQTFEMEYRFKRDDGEYAYIYDRCILLRDEKDQPVRMIGAAQNISERKRLEKELIKNELDYQRMLHQATVDSQEKERAEIGKELHDNVNQVLTTTKLYLDLALLEPAKKEELIHKSLLNINNIIQEIRHLSRSLMDPSIGDLGLIASIDDLIENIHLTQKLVILFRADEEVEDLLDASQKLALFRIIQESLNNVLRHAEATTVSIEIAVRDSDMLLIIKDDGIGFGLEKLKKGVGLKNIQNRIYLIHGTLDLQSKPGDGCILTLQFPIKTSQ